MEPTTTGPPATGPPATGPPGLGDPTEALAERLIQAQIGAFELYALYLGERLGLYRALTDGGPATSAELAARTGTVERYVREWLEHQAVSGLLTVDDVGADPLDRRYTLPLEYVPVLVDREDVRYGGYVGVDLVRAARPLPQLVEAFRHGGAPPRLPWEPEGRAEVNRALFLNLLGTQWLPSIPPVDQARRRGWPIWPVDPAGRASRWHWPIPRSRSPDLIWTATSSRWPLAMPRLRVSRTGSSSSLRTPPTPD
jgi:hypothetical protein